MGAPKVITVPSKSYVAINSYRSDRSVPPTLCDLGRVSGIAAAVTLPRAANFVNRSNVVPSEISLPIKKRPISEVTDCSDSNSSRGIAPTERSAANATGINKKIKFTLATRSTVIPNIVRDCESNQQEKAMKLNSTENSSMLPLPEVSSANKREISSASHLQRNLGNQLPTSQSTYSPPRIPFQHQVQFHSQETEACLHLQINPQGSFNAPNNTNQNDPQQPTPVMGQLRTHHSVPTQLQQQNQQLRNENAQLQKQLSLFRQLIKNPQRLSQVLARLEQRVH